MVSHSATQAARIVPTFSGDAARWEAVIRRDRVADGTFYDAVQTTGIYCRPAGTVRRARRENVPFWLLLDFRVVALTKACHPIFVSLSSSKPLSFKCLQVELKALGQIAA
jgi:hypothetical protein